VYYCAAFAETWRGIRNGEIARTRWLKRHMIDRGRLAQYEKRYRREASAARRLGQA
jgi:hypothetical protein